ncbi:HEAT repeat domain-containing protein [Thermopolyspora sp. NPDC052614]|uniref:HEAT repeat domain-containing protein n=1 Tax=Thermopolyspora sp. NPDC052614 TaxID=3155682 RepID=UPI003416285A
MGGGLAMIAEEFERRFGACVTETGARYTAARDRLLAEGDDVLPRLRESADHDDWRVSGTARILLGHLQRPSLIEQVDRIVRDRPLDPRTPGFGVPPAVVARELAALGENAVPRLLEIATKTNEFATVTGPQIVLQAIALVGDRRAVPPLLDLLGRTGGSDGDAGDEQVRMLTASALGELARRGDDDVRDALMGLLFDDDAGPAPRVTAALSLGRLGDPTVIDALAPLARPDVDVMLRTGAIRAIGYAWQSSRLTDDPVPAEPVPAEAELAELLDGEHDETVALELVGALGRLDAPASAGRLGLPGPASEALRRAADDHRLPSVRHSAGNVLNRVARDARRGGGGPVISSPGGVR